eukprot:20134-Eustigmatos_ZCMA.PRE.1
MSRSSTYLGVSSAIQHPSTGHTVAAFKQRRQPQRVRQQLFAALYLRQWSRVCRSCPVAAVPGS